MSEMNCILTHNFFLPLGKILTTSVYCMCNSKGACGTCPSSTQTLKMGLERGLIERIPEIQEVVQSMPEGPPLTEEQINVVLDGVRPFLQVAGGSIDCDRIEGEGGLQPAIFLEMKGSSASLNSVKLEIAQRLQKHFMVAGLRVEWVGKD